MEGRPGPSFLLHRKGHIEEPSSWVKDRTFIYILYACLQCLPFREAKCIELLIEKWASAMSQEWHKGKPEIPSPIEPTKYKICGCRFRKGEVPLLTIPGMVVLGGVFRSESAWRSSTSFDPWPCWAEVLLATDTSPPFRNWKEGLFGVTFSFRMNTRWFNVTFWF